MSKYVIKFKWYFDVVYNIVKNKFWIVNSDFKFVILKIICGLNFENGVNVVSGCYVGLVNWIRCLIVLKVLGFKDVRIVK